MDESEKNSRAKALFESGLRLFKKGQYNDALGAFLVAKQHGSRKSIQYNIARCYEKLDDAAAAYETYQELLELFDQELSEEERSTANASLEALGERTGLIVFTVNEPRASVTISSNLVGITPIEKPIRRNRGRYTVEITKSGFETFTEELEIRGGDRVLVDAFLSRKQLPCPDCREGFVCEDGSCVSACDPPCPEDETCNAERICVSDESTPLAYEPDKPVETEEPEETRASESLEGSRSKGTAGDVLEVFGIATLGVASAVLISGVSTGIVAIVKQKESEDHCNPDDKTICSEKGGELIDEAKDFATVANISFGVAAAGAIIGLVLLASAPSDETNSYSHQRIRLRPALGSESFGAMIDGTF